MLEQKKFLKKRKHGIIVDIPDTYQPRWTSSNWAALAQRKWHRSKPSCSIRRWRDRRGGRVCSTADRRRTRAGRPADTTDGASDQGKNRVERPPDRPASRSDRIYRTLCNDNTNNINNHQQITKRGKDNYTTHITTSSFDSLLIPKIIIYKQIQSHNDESGVDNNNRTSWTSKTKQPMDKTDPIIVGGHFDRNEPHERTPRPVRVLDRNLPVPYQRLETSSNWGAAPQRT